MIGGRGSDSEWANSLWSNCGSLQTTDFVLHQTLTASCVPTAKFLAQSRRSLAAW
jgi:hypothetical protein